MGPYVQREIFRVNALPPEISYDFSNTSLNVYPGKVCPAAGEEAELDSALAGGSFLH
jgi:hypothetical protein